MATKNSEVKAKVGRRGIGTARGVQRKKFSHEDANAKNGLFLAHIEDVQVAKVTIGEETTGLPSFTGMEVPRLSITFASNDPVVANRRYVTLSFMAVESNVNTCFGGKDAWMVDSTLDWLNHLVTTFITKGRELTEEEAAALSLPFDDVDENGEFVNIDTQEVIDGWTTLFTNFANMINTCNEGNPAYKTKDNKPISLWIKLLRCQKTRKKGWFNISNGDLAFPSFVGEGCIEIFKQNAVPSIRLDATKESIIPRVEDKAKTPSAIGAGAAAPSGAAVIDGGYNTQGVDNMGMEESPF